MIKIYTYARDFQLGVVIRKEGKPIDFYGRELTDTQRRYTVSEKELLNIVENLKQLQTILLGQKLKIYADNKNITCIFLNTDRVFI